MELPPADFESAASASSAIPAYSPRSLLISHLFHRACPYFYLPKNIGVSSGVGWDIQCVSSIA